MKLHSCTPSSLVLLLSLASAPAAVLSNPAITNVSSEFSGAFAAAFLFDGNPTFGAPTGQGNQWAGAGVGPHTISFDFGSAKTIGYIGYAQRAGSIATTDKVTSIQFTWSNTPDFSVSTTSSLTVTNTANNSFWAYDLGAPFNAQYVRAVFTGNGGNPGGSELRFFEPARTALPRPTIIGTPSQFSAAFAASNLFDGVGDAGLRANNNQWAGAGVGPHSIDFDFGGLGVSLNALGYAQRAGDNPALDKVTSIDLFLSDTAGVFAPTPTTSLTITNTTNPDFTEYALGGSFAGRYLRAVFNGTGGNPGGSELRFYGTPVPEVSSAFLVSLAGSTLALRRRRSR